MRRYNKGNVVKFGNSFWIISEVGEDERGQWFGLISMSACNCSSGVSENPSHDSFHVDKLEYVAQHVYDFIEKGMLKFLDDLGKGI